MTTITDVAKRAGVSIKTVSRVLNNEPHVRDALRKRVEDSASELNYRPNQAARRLAGKRSFLIAYLYDNPNPAYVSSIQAGAAQRCLEIGYHLVVEALNDHHQHDVREVIDRLVAALSPDGLILTPPLSNNPDMISALRRHGANVVFIAGAGCDFGVRIRMNDMEAGRAMTEHLLALGHRRIGMVRGHPDHAAAARRFDGYNAALEAAGIRPDPKLAAQGFFDIQSGIEAGRALLSQKDRPTAVFASNDEMALGVMIAAREMGLDVPGDLSVAGFDDTPMSRHIFPPLTTIRQPLEEMGRSSIDALLAGAEAQSEIELPFELAARASTAAPGKASTRS